jgi:hypothetical protein
MGVVVSFGDARQKIADVRMDHNKPAWGKFSDQKELESFNQYILQSESWANGGYWETLYEGFPFVPPCKAPRGDMIWYVNPDMQHYGVWVLNQSNMPIEVNQGHFGWNPFVRKTTAPPYEPLNVASVQNRTMLSWVVDEDGYGQYGLVLPGGYVWVPSPRPKDWIDPNPA